VIYITINRSTNYLVEMDGVSTLFSLCTVGTNVLYVLHCFAVLLYFVYTR